MTDTSIEWVLVLPGFGRQLEKKQNIFHFTGHLGVSHTISNDGEKQFNQPHTYCEQLWEPGAVLVVDDRAC